MQNKKKIKNKKSISTNSMTEWIEAKNRVWKTFLGIYDVRMCFELINICFLRYLEGEGGGRSLTKGKSSS